MLNQQIVNEQQEQIRRQIRELSEEQRKIYYKLFEKRVKDPDTYATLNYIFIAGLHHFYIGKWQLGLLNISAFVAGIGLIVAEYVELGIAVIVGIALFELYELFRSQVIVHAHNNQISLEVLSEVQSGSKV